MLFNLFKNTPLHSFAELLRVDIHSHLIPGIDDGSPTVETSLNFLNRLQLLGYKKVITTPHIIQSVYPNTAQTILNGLENLKTACYSHNINLDIEASAEYYLDTNFEELLHTDKLIGIGAENYLLFELSFVSAHLNFEDILFQMQAKGYKPILAHPERYKYWYSNEAVFEKLKTKEVFMQINLPSLLGYYGDAIKKWAYKLINLGYIDFLGTDLHHEKHLQLLEKNKYNKELLTIITNTPFKNKTLL